MDYKKNPIIKRQLSTVQIKEKLNSQREFIDNLCIILNRRYLKW